MLNSPKADENYKNRSLKKIQDKFPPKTSGEKEENYVPLNLFQNMDNTLLNSTEMDKEELQQIASEINRMKQHPFGRTNRE